MLVNSRIEFVATDSLKSTFRAMSGIFCTRLRLTFLFNRLLIVLTSFFTFLMSLIRKLWENEYFVEVLMADTEFSRALKYPSCVSGSAKLLPSVVLNRCN